MTEIHCSFENMDRLDVAMSRLRQKGIAFKISSANSGYSHQPAMSQFVANILFPHQPMNLTSPSIASPVPEVGSRVVLGAETMGIPVHGYNSEAHVRFTFNDDCRDTAKSIIRNCGGYNLR